MTELRRYVLVEGHGEADAVLNLLVRMARARSDSLAWAPPLRWANLHQWSADKRGGVQAGVDFIRGKKNAASLLILRDADEGCPRQLAPAVATQLRALGAPFPVAYVLFKPEYEVLFLPCLARMAGRELDGRPGLVAGATWTGAHWEAKRGLKEWLSNHFAPGKIYKPTMDQRALTQLIDLDTLRRADVPCFGTLERALSFLVAPGATGVYP